MDWIRRLILFHNKRHPAEMAEQELTEFLRHLARDVHVAASTREGPMAGLTAASAHRGGQLFFSVADHFAAHRAAIDAGEVFFHCRCEQ